LLAKYFIDEPEAKKFGFYQVRDFRSFSKYEAWQYAFSNQIPFEELYFNFNDDYTTTFNWQVEPLTDINKLYANRAKQLRENYDYIVLVYSGGIDSHVALQSFLDNGIKIDEILTFCNLKFLDKSAKFNQEVFNVAVPYIEELKLKGTKFNLFDIGDTIQKAYGNTDHLNNFLYITNGVLTTWTATVRSSLIKLQQEHQLKLSREGKKIAYIWGLEKPHMLINDDYYAYHYYSYAQDFAARNFYSKYIYGNELANFTDETFFICREFPEILIKQAHLVAKELKVMSPNDARLVGVEKLANTGPYVQHSSSINSETGKWLKKQELEKIIYPNAPHGKFGDDKIPGSAMFSSRDSWFYRSKHPNRNTFIEKIKKTLREHESYFNFLPDGTASNGVSISGYSHKIIKY
jgi:hypothetical protein